MLQPTPSLTGLALASVSAETILWSSRRPHLPSPPLHLRTIRGATRGKGRSGSALTLSAAPQVAVATPPTEEALRCASQALGAILQLHVLQAL